MNRRERAVFVISVAAELAGMHPQTLRIYERKGLIEPFRTPGGTRRYSQEDIDRLALIQELTEQGLNLEGVKRIMAMQAEIEHLRGKIEALESELSRTRAEMRSQAQQIHQSYRHEIVLRSEVLPEVRRNRNR
ncbi:MAG: MerR family transcriptional regulator [Acidimicrobiia bacterium]|nr:MerR family transcriptional regulator [Acidimicrobiia bacterium]MDH4306618.1 MerR family transcriptional regulator [Acidimicrobiia bacterium]MDH5292072.1 MerR family transcriptional regulator [Acidimicrobiia bacterium]MDH5520666.1 MerR family transcriptional regulator [Acidimicrobiia bacterium]